VFRDLLYHDNSLIAFERNLRYYKKDGFHHKEADCLQSAQCLANVSHMISDGFRIESLSTKAETKIELLRLANSQFPPLLRTLLVGGVFPLYLISASGLPISFFIISQSLSSCSLFSGELIK
jgi:hypothetical protein